MKNDYRQKLEALQEKGLTRQRRTVCSPQGPLLEVDGQQFLAFASNDYLGLASHPDLIRAAHDALDHYGLGAGASALVCGHSKPVAELEVALASWLGLERALHFSTGYMANFGAIPALIGKEAAVFSDALNHACLIDGIRLARPAELTVYRHADVAQVEAGLGQTLMTEKWIITDGVFSMDGDVAPLPDLLALAERYDARILVDDAHGFGILGHAGRGTMSHWGLASPRVVYMATLGKAAGVFGAFVAGAADTIEWLLQRARTYIFTTGTPPVLAAACLVSLERIRNDQFRRDRLRQLGRQLQDGARGLPWPLLPSETAIHPLILGDNFTALRIAGSLREQGLWVPAIRPPTVPPGQARLRISLSASHEPSHVERLLTALRRLS